MINEEGVKPKITRTEAVLKIKPPRNVKETRSFLGSVQYLAKFIENLSAKTEPIRRLAADQQTAFDFLKEDNANITKLKHCDPNAKTISTKDACTKGLGATHWQEDEHGRLAVAFASRFLNSTEQRYAINELELLGVNWATEHFNFYLLGRKFTVETDHKALVSVLGKHRTHKEYSVRLTRWRVRLLPYEFNIIYTPGSRMGITDYLSRSPHETPPPCQEDEGELVIGILRELNVQKNAHFLKQALEHGRIETPFGEKVSENQTIKLG